MNGILTLLGRWDLDVRQVHQQMYGAPTPRDQHLRKLQYRECIVGQSMMRGSCSTMSCRFFAIVDNLVS